MTAADTTQDVRSRFAQLKAPLPKDRIRARRDGRPVPRGNKSVARFVRYIDAQLVQERLDECFLGEWTLSVEALADAADDDGTLMKVMLATLTILGLTRQDVGMGTTPKNATTDAFKRVAVRFGIGAELYDGEQLWVEVDQSGKEVEDPALAYERLIAQKAPASESFAAPAPRSAPPPVPASPPRPAAAPAPTPAPSAPAPAKPSGFGAIAPIPCPRCGGKMWDNRTIRTGSQPDYKCMHPETCPKDAKGRTGAVWLDESERRILDGGNRVQVRAAIEAGLDEPDDDLPF